MVCPHGCQQAHVHWAQHVNDLAPTWHAAAVAGGNGMTSMARSHGCGGSVGQTVGRRHCGLCYRAANRLRDGQIGCKARPARLQGGGPVGWRGEGGEVVGRQGKGHEAARRGWRGNRLGMAMQPHWEHAATATKGRMPVCTSTWAFNGRVTHGHMRLRANFF